MVLNDFPHDLRWRADLLSGASKSKLSGCYMHAYIWAWFVLPGQKTNTGQIKPIGWYGMIWWLPEKINNDPFQAGVVFFARANKTISTIMPEIRVRMLLAQQVFTLFWPKTSCVGTIWEGIFTFWDLRLSLSSWFRASRPLEPSELFNFRGNN